MLHALPSSAAKTCVVCGASFGPRVGPAYAKQEARAGYLMRRCCSRACRSTFYAQHPYARAVVASDPMKKGVKPCIVCGRRTVSVLHCLAHNKRLINYGDANAVRRPARSLLGYKVVVPPARQCDRCDLPAMRDSTLCGKHRRRQRILSGELRFPDLPPNSAPGPDQAKTCFICGKPNAKKKRGMCFTHYDLWRFHRRVLREAEENV